MKRRWPGTTLALFLLLTSQCVSAWQDADVEAPSPGEQEQSSGDPLNRDTPLGSVRGFVEAAEAFDWDLAAQFLDLRNLPPRVRKIDGRELAEQLYFILQRREISIDAEQISNRPGGALMDDLPEYRDILARIETGRGETTLLMQRVPGDGDGYVWKISNATVAEIPDLYDEFRYPEWVESLRGSLPADKSFLGLELFKWIILLGYALVITPIAWLIAWGVAHIVSKPGAPLWKEVRAILTGPIVALVVLNLLNDLLWELGVGAIAARWIEARTVLTVVVIWFFWAAANLWRARRRHRYELEGRTDAAVLGRPVANAFKLLTLLVGILVWLANAGVDISALLAGLGIGGIAVALALQKPIEDLFGAISIYSQQPVNTGDLCRYGTEVGRVEEIGLRTTRIRTLTNTLVSVPNSHFSAGVIENLTARTKILYQPDLPLRYDTDRKKLELVLAALQKLAEDNPMIENATIRVRLVEFTLSAILVRLRLFVKTTDFDAYLKVVSDFNLDVLQLMDDSGVRFSQGAQTLFLKDGGLMPARQAFDKSNST